MKLRKYCALFLLSLWLFLTVFAWFRPADALSDAERQFQQGQDRAGVQ